VAVVTTRNGTSRFGMGPVAHAHVRRVSLTLRSISSISMECTICQQRCDVTVGRIRVGPCDPPYERDQIRVASHVMVNRRCAVQRMFATSFISPRLHRSSFQRPMARRKRLAAVRQVCARLFA
jgi:hypothetical protein